MAGGDLSDGVSVRARFERFPATLKGAFILRGEDADPHQVAFLGGRVAGIGMQVSIPMPMAPATLDIAPHRDVFVPFEMPVTELEPGWYTLQAELEVDGTPEMVDGGRRFSVPWPRATVRRGHVKVERVVDVGQARVRLEQVDCGGDSMKVLLTVDPPEPVELRLSADGDRIEILEVEFEEGSGRTRVISYPVMRAHGVLLVQIRGRGKGADAQVEVPLPG